MEGDHKDFLKLADPGNIGSSEYRAVYELLADLYYDPAEAMQQPPMKMVLAEIASVIKGIEKRIAGGDAGCEGVTSWIGTTRPEGVDVDLCMDTGEVVFTYCDPEASGIVRVKPCAWGPLIDVDGYDGHPAQDGLILIDLFRTSENGRDVGPEGEKRFVGMMVWADPSSEDPSHNISFVDVYKDPQEVSDETPVRVRPKRGGPRSYG